MALFLGISFYGLDFGYHWDETAAKFDSVRDTLATGLFIQGSAGAWDGVHYNYGGVNYLLTWAGFTPQIWRFITHGHQSRAKLSEIITPLVYTMPIRLRVRAIYLIICSLSILWLFLLNDILGRSRLESFLAAAILAASWEVQYHSRWIAPDEVMMQFALLSFLLLAVGWSSKKFYWFYLGAISVGLTIGTKYTGGLVLPFFLLGALSVVWQQSRSAAAVLKKAVALGGSTVLTFVLTSPAILIDPFHFFYQVKLQKTIYGTGWYGNTVKPGFPHFLLIVKYFGLQMFSHYWILSLVLGAFCLVGFASIMIGKPRMIGLMLTGFVLAYLAYFSLQAAMIVRNLLVVVPVLCMATARGITLIGERLDSKSPKLKVGLYAGIAILLSINVGWELYAARQIKRRQDFNYFVTKFEDYARNSPQDTYLVSAKLLLEIQGIRSAAIPGNIITDTGKPYTKVAFLQSEGPEKLWPTWPSNWWGEYETTFGALEVNLDAYPTFMGNQRILLSTADHFRKLPLKLEDIAH